MDDAPIKAKFRRVDPAGPWVKWTCSLCGGSQADGPWAIVEAEVEDLSVIVCGDCIEWNGEQPGCIDDGLEQAAAKAEHQAGLLRSLVGRLRVPTYAQWRAADQAAEKAWKDGEKQKREAKAAAEARAAQARADWRPVSLRLH
jgi:hypothetical protein